MTRENYIDLEEAVFKLQTERDVFMMKKKVLENELSILNNKVRSKTIPLTNNEYNGICRRQTAIKIELNDIQKNLTMYKSKIQEKYILKEKVKNNIENNLETNTNILEQVISLKDKYRSFSSDQTRVSSMRVMASQICSDLELIIKNK